MALRSSACWPELSAGYLSAALQSIPLVAPFAETIVFLIVVAIITCLSVVVGELISRMQARIGLDIIWKPG